MRESILSFRPTSLFFVSARTNKRHQSIRGWEMEAKRRRCNSLLEKSDFNLRKELLEQRQKDVLLIPQDWYPEYRDTDR